MIFLLDKSAHEIARRDDRAHQVFETMAITGFLASCAMIELEILYSARNPAEHRMIREYLREHCLWLETTDAMMLEAIDLQEQMHLRGSHRKPLPDLIIAAVARMHDAILVHYDSDFDVIGLVAKDLRTRWIVPRH